MLLWTLWAASALAVYSDQAYIDDWQFYGVGVPFAALSTESGHVLLTEKNQLALVDASGQIRWRKEVKASRIAAGNGTVYTQSNSETTAWDLESGTRLGSVPGGHALCADDSQVAVARGPNVLVYSPALEDTKITDYGAEVVAVECLPEGVFGIVAGKAAKDTHQPTLSDSGISVDEFGVVSGGDWTRPEGLTDVVSACFLEIESQSNKPELPRLSGVVMEDWTARVKRHVDKLTKLRPSSTVGSKELLFGYHKALVLATSRGSLYAFDTLNRSIRWEKHVGVTSVEAINNVAVATLTDGSKVAFNNAGEQVEVPPTTVPEFDVQIESNRVIGLQNGAETWEFTGNILTTARRDPREVTSNVGTVVGDNKVQYKYLNPNLIAIATLQESRLSVSVLDGITGRTLYINQVEDPVFVDENHPVSMVMGEHWVVFSYTSLDELASSKLTVLDFYESPILNERLSPNAVDPFTDSAVPWVSQRTLVLPKPITALGTSVTHFGVTRREILAATDIQVFSIPKHVLSALSLDEGNQKNIGEVDTVLQVPPQAILSHERVVKKPSGFATATTLLESTYAVCAYGGPDIFYTLAAPSGEFDRLPQTFETSKLLLIIASLTVLVFFLRPLARNRTLKTEWA